MNEKTMKKRMKRGIIFTTVIGALILTAVVTNMYMMDKSLRTMTREQMRTEAEEYKKRLNRQVNENYELLHTLAAVIEYNNLTKAEQFAKSLYESNLSNHFTTMAYIGKDGDGMMATKEKALRFHMESDFLDSDIRNTVQKALEGQEVISDLFESSFSREKLFACGVPVYKDGEVSGALLATDSIEVFSELLEGETILSGSGYFHLVDSQGNFLVRSSRVIIKEMLESIFEGTYFSSDNREKMKRAMNSNEQTFASFRYQGKKYTVFLEPTEINGWYLFCVNTREGANHLAYHMIGTFVAVFICVLLLSLVLLLYSYRLIFVNNKELSYLAYHDVLTGADNFMYFHKKAGEALQRKEGCTVAALNIHQFKFVNEIFGKEKADQILCYVYSVIVRHLRTEEFSCRSSADLFYLFLWETDREQVCRRLQEIMDEISERARVMQSSYRILLYAGAVILESQPKRELLENTILTTHALFALASAKTMPPNSVCIYDTEQHKKEELKNYVESHMNTALQKEEFKLFLQPKINLQTNKLGGAEALVRWVTDNGRTIYPDQFIPLFEKNGFCVHLDMYMVELVCRQIRAWMDQGVEPVPLSVNQSKLLFFETNYLEWLQRLLEKYEVPAQYITLEILEGLALKNADELNEKIMKIRKMGFKISMDDFGSGYSSLNTLGKLDIDELKLDRGFLIEASDQDNKRFTVIMEHIVNLAKHLDISVVVEGVETSEDERFIKSLGCDYGQGYYYSRPISAAEFNEKINEIQ